MRNTDPDSPAFPATEQHGCNSGVSGMTLRQYAAITLKVPNSGTDWLDDMIRASLRDATDWIDTMPNCLGDGKPLKFTQPAPADPTPSYEAFESWASRVNLEPVGFTLGRMIWQAAQAAQPTAPTRTLAAPVTDEEVDAAFSNIDMMGNFIEVAEMRRALEGFAAGRAAGVAPAGVEPAKDDRFSPFAMVLRDVAELDHAPSDADAGDLLMVSPDELRTIMERHLTEPLPLPAPVERNPGTNAKLEKAVENAILRFDFLTLNRNMATISPAAGAYELREALEAYRAMP